MTSHPMSMGQIIPFSPATQREPTPAITPPTPLEEAWNAYSNHLKKWFYEPDIEAARISLAVVASHYHKDCDPVWLFVLGPSSGDKTSICINSTLDLPNVYMKGDLTSKTFLSGYTGTANPSLLHQIGSGILAFKDFTTFASKRPEEQAELSAQLREIYDGAFVKDTGKGQSIKWTGKLTVIVAATPKLEEAWSTRRDLGERFLQVRIGRKDGIEQGEFAQRQRGYEEFIGKTTRQLAKEFFQCMPPILNPPPRPSSNQMHRIATMAEIVAHCRGCVSRHPYTQVITDLPAIENSGRMSKQLASLISNHAALFRKGAVEEGDMAIGKRVALNTIPSKRAAVLSAVPIDQSIDTDQLQLQLGLPPSTIGLIVGDLESLGVLQVTHNTVIANEVSLTSRMKRLWKEAFDPLSLHPHPQDLEETAASHQ